MKYYIAYGSNISQEQMAVRCPEAMPIGTALLKDYELVFRYHATIEPKAGATVPVLVWEISDADERRLDVYEGYPEYYDKKELDIDYYPFHDAMPYRISAMVYIMTGNNPISAPSRSYYNGIMEGYKRFSLNCKTLRKALHNALGYMQ